MKFGTPMNGVLAWWNLLATSLSDKQRHFSPTIRDSGTLFSTLINEILDFSKIEANKVDLEQAEFECFLRSGRPGSTSRFQRKGARHGTEADQSPAAAVV